MSRKRTVVYKGDYDDRETHVLDPGDVVRQSGRVLIVGHVNALGGGCDDCMDLAEGVELEVLGKPARR